MECSTGLVRSLLNRVLSLLLEERSDLDVARYLLSLSWHDAKKQLLDAAHVRLGLQ